MGQAGSEVVRGGENQSLLHDGAGFGFRLPRRLERAFPGSDATVVDRGEILPDAIIDGPAEFVPELAFLPIRRTTGQAGWIGSFLVSDSSSAGPPRTAHSPSLIRPSAPWVARSYSRRPAPSRTVRVSLLVRAILVQFLFASGAIELVVPGPCICDVDIYRPRSLLRERRQAGRGNSSPGPLARCLWECSRPRYSRPSRGRRPGALGNCREDLHRGLDRDCRPSRRSVLNSDRLLPFEYAVTSTPWAPSPRSDRMLPERQREFDPGRPREEVEGLRERIDRERKLRVSGDRQYPDEVASRCRHSKPVQSLLERMRSSCAR